MNLSSIIILSDYFEPSYSSPWCFYQCSDADLTVLNYGLIESRIDYSKISKDYKYIPANSVCYVVVDQMAIIKNWKF